MIDSNPSKLRSKKVRLFELLLMRGLADSEAHSKAMIMSGDVVVDDQRVDKPGTLVPVDIELRLKDEGRFVSRGGDKLEGAIIELKLETEFKGKNVLDVGSSTGGFTDCVLTYGATQVVAVDVGTAQLAWKLRNDPRVISIEKTDIKNLKPDGLPKFDWVVADVSFTSLARLLSDIKRVASQASLLLLVKPQFELPREFIPSGGVVENHADRMMALNHVKAELVELKYKIISEMDAKVLGRQGNRELFIFAIPHE